MKMPMLRAPYPPSHKKMGLRGMAEQIREQGTEGDDILAHLNPEEAQYLMQTQGMSMNPYTGLPEFGFLRKLEKKLRPITKKALPVVGALMGNMFAPGLGGAMIGGALGGAASSSRHRLDHALGGALIGAGGHALFGGSAAAPAAASTAGASAPTAGGGLLSKLGLGGGTAKAAGLLGAGKYFLGGQKGVNTGDELEKEEEKKNFFQNLIGQAGNWMTEHPMETLLGTIGVGGTLLSKPKLPKQLGPTAEEQFRAYEARQAPRYGVPKPLQRKYIQPTAEEQRRLLEEGIVPSFFEEVNPVEGYARGGHVSGYIDGEDGGQDDTIPADIRPGAYVMDATTTSLLGDGNPDRGNELLESWEDKALRSGVINRKHFGTSHNVKVLLSPKERVMSEEFVTKLGKGDNSKGAKLLDKFRKRVKRHKGLKVDLPPKSKPISHYLGGK